MPPIAPAEQPAAWQARIDLAAAHRLAVAHDMHEGIDNHFTCLVPGKPERFLLNAFGLHWSEVAASNLIEVGFDAEVLDGEGVADLSALCIHAPIHRARPDAACVLHTHMPYATALSELEDMTLEPIGQVALMFAGKVAYDYDYAGFAQEFAEGERMAAVMREKSVLMLANHGVIVAGESVAQAFYRLYYFERACRTQLFAMWTSKARRHVTDAVIDKMREQAKHPDPRLAMSPAEYFFAAYKRLLDKSEPDYAS